MSDSENYRIYTTKQEAHKALSTLSGIINGFSLDNFVPDEEVNELHLWCKKHQHLIDRYPIKEFITSIKSQLHISLSQEERQEILEDIYWLSIKYEKDNDFYNLVTRDLQYLQGLCHGVLSDGVLADDEIVGIHDWLNDHQHLIGHFPYDEISSLLLEILGDGVIEDQERIRLKAYLNEFVSLNNQEVNNSIIQKIKDINIGGICTSNPEIIFPEKSFCLTGTLKIGPKKEISDKILNLGGEIHTSLRVKTDYLIVGSDGNPAWAFACYGRKVEKAMEIRRNGGKISIIHEGDFNDALLESYN